MDDSTFQYNKTINEIVGWSGFISLLVAYALLSFEVTDNQNILSSINMYGAFTVGYVSYLKEAWQAVILEVAWFLIALVTLIMYNI